MPTGFPFGKRPELARIRFARSGGTPPINPRRWRPLVFAVSAILFVASCATQPDTSEDVPSDTTSGSSEEGTEPFSLADCQSRFGHPCSYQDVDIDVRALQAEYSAEVTSRLRDQSREEAHEWIQGQDGVAETHLSQTLLMFRLEGGMPFSIISPIAEPPPGFLDESGAAEASGYQSPDPGLLVSLQSGGLGGNTRAVVGVGTDRENPQNRKKALFLEPWGSDEGSIFSAVGRVDPTELFKAIDDYDHGNGVVHTVDANADPLWFTSDVWREYDFIYVSTHGGTWPDGAVLESGVRREWDGDDATYEPICDELMEPYQHMVGLECGIQQTGETQYLTVDMTHIFFMSQYFNTSVRLDKTVIYVEACESLKYGILADIIAGDTSIYLGWSEQINLSAARDVSALLMVQLTTRMRAVGPALHNMAQQGRAGGPRYRDPEATGDPYLNPHSVDPDVNKLRLYDLPTFRDPKAPTNILDNGAELPIDGTAGDGEHDKLDITVDLMGVIDPDDTSGDLTNVVAEGSPADLYNLRFFIGDEERDVGVDNLGRAVNPTATTTDLGDNNYRYTFTAELGFDVDPDDNETTLKVVVELPEGGISDYEIEVELVSSAATITVGGQTWDFVLSDTFGNCSVGEAATFVAGSVDGDIHGVSFSASLGPDGGLITVDDPDADEKWMAAADREGMTDLHLVPQGHSQIDQITVDGGRFYGTATFIDTEAFREALFYNTAYPQPVTGSFDIQCG